MSTQSTQVTPQVAAPEQATATPEQGDNAVGTVGWAMNLARTAGNNHMMGILGGLTGGPAPLGAPPPRQAPRPRPARRRPCAA